MRQRVLSKGARLMSAYPQHVVTALARLAQAGEPQKIPLVMSPDETRRLLAVVDNLKVRTLLGLGYGCGLHYGLFANGHRAANIARARELLAGPPHETDGPAEPEQLRVLPKPCPCCGGRMIIIETFARGCQPKHRPTPAPIIRIDTS